MNFFLFPYSSHLLLQNGCKRDWKKKIILTAAAAISSEERLEAQPLDGLRLSPPHYQSLPENCEKWSFIHSAIELYCCGCISPRLVFICTCAPKRCVMQIRRLFSSTFSRKSIVIWAAFYYTTFSSGRHERKKNSKMDLESLHCRLFINSFFFIKKKVLKNRDGIFFRGYIFITVACWYVLFDWYLKKKERP